MKETLLELTQGYQLYRSRKARDLTDRKTSRLFIFSSGYDNYP